MLNHYFSIHTCNATIMEHPNNAILYQIYANISKVVFVSVDVCCGKANGVKWCQKLTYVRYQISLSWENLFLPYANNKDADQPVHPCSLISVFVIRWLDSMIPPFAISKTSSCKLVSVAAQDGLSLTWSQTSKTGFLVTWLTWVPSWHQSDAHESSMSYSPCAFRQLLQ